MAGKSVMRRGRLFTAAALAAAAALTIGALTPASASVPASANPPDSVQDQQHNHTMGSQVAKHLGHRAAGTARFGPDDVVYGMDVSAYQGNVDWQTAWNNGARFAAVKATEGTYYTSPDFAQQYNGSYNVGMIRGAYHFATPNTTSGATQANFFVDNGGGWSRDGKTLPGELDIEWNPYGADCYGLSAGGMVQWILDFSNTYHARTGVWPLIYTAQSWWQECTGNQGDFSSTNPLWVASYSSSVGTLPYAWTYTTFWQYADSGTFPGDQDLFTAGYDRLQALANAA